MKKLLFVLLAGMLMLTGCGGGNDDKSGEAPKSNVGLCDIGQYTSSGTSATGEELDIELTLKQYNEAIAKLEEYNTFVNGLKDKKYDDVKFAWEKLYKGIRESDKIVQSNEIKAKSGLDLKTDKLSQYQTAFQKYINALSES